MTNLSRKSLGSVWIVLALIASLAGSWHWRGRFATSIAAPLTPANAATNARLNEAYGKLPLSFEANQGQADSAIKFLSHGGGQSLRLEAAKVVLNMRESESLASSVSLHFLNANPAPHIEGEAELPGKSNYLVGADKRAWRTKIPTYAKVRYRELWPGVDAVFYGNPQQLEYDFVIAPGADPHAIRLRFDGVKKISLDANGDLMLQFDGRELRQQRPVVYQEFNGEKRRVACRYVVRGKQVGFEFGRYRRNRELVIDPVLNYAARTYANRGIAVDAQGNAYTVAANGDFFISKLNAAGTQMIYATTIGGTDIEVPTGIAVDAAGAVYATGRSFSTEFAGNFPLVNPATGAGVLFKSLDAARNWNSSGKGLSFIPSKLIVDPTNSNVIYAGYSLQPTFSKSTDGGASWSRVGPLPGGGDSPVTLLAVAPVGAGVLYASVNDGLRKSSDGGTTWMESGLNQPVTSLVFDPRNPRTLYASVKATPAVVYKSVDGGETWNRADRGLRDIRPAEIRLSLDSATPTTIYAIAIGLLGGSVPANALFRSVDGGANWAAVTLPEPVSVYSAASDPANSSIVYVGTIRGVFKSTDGAKSWQRIGLNGLSVHTLAVDPFRSPTLYALVSAGGSNANPVGQIYKSANGGADWELIDNRLKDAAVYSFTLDPQNPARLCAGTNTLAEAVALKLNATGASLEYATYLGGVSGAGIAVDASGNALIAGEGAPRESRNGLPVASPRGFLVKLDPRGEVAYASGLPGPGNGVAVDGAGKAYVAGEVSGPNTLLVKNGFQTNAGGGAFPDGFVLKLDPQLAGENSLLYSTYLGGGNADEVNAIAVDAGGRVYVTGSTASPDFPTTGGALSAAGGLFCAKIAPAESGRASLSWSTRMGGFTANAISVDGAGQVFIAGAAGAGFPTTPGAFQTAFAGGDCGTVTCTCPLVMGFCRQVCQPIRPACTDAFVSKLDAEGTILLYSTYLGSGTNGLNESANAIALDPAGNVYVTGAAVLSVTPGAFQSPAFDRGFIAKLTFDARGTTVASVSAANYLGPELAAQSLAVGFLDAFGGGANRLQVKVRDSKGADRDALTLFSGSGQVNFEIPEGTANGDATVRVTNEGAAIASGLVRVVDVAPGLFTFDATGRGLPAAFAQRIRNNTTIAYEPIARFDAQQNRFVPVPIDFGPEGDVLYLVLYGTGFRNRSALSAVKVTLGGAEMTINYAGPQLQLVGLDQINVFLPRSLAGKGDVEVVVTADGKMANPVRVSIR